MRLDHIVFGAMDITSGLDWMQRQTGYNIPSGGQHLQMGTHNHLSRLDVAGQAEAAYFEVIAPDPSLPRPDHARWFSFDDQAHQAVLRASPRPIAWVMAVVDMSALLEGLPEDLRTALGRPVTLSRGDLTWTICLREDGLLPDGGLLPLLIEWPDQEGPAMRMPDIGLSLQDLILQHPDPAGLQRHLSLLGIDLAGMPVLAIRQGPHALDFGFAA